MRAPHAPGEARRGIAPAGPFCVMGPDRVGSCAFAASSAAHRRRALAASPGKPSKGPCARGPVRRRTAVYHAPVGPQRGGLSLPGPSSVLGRSRRRGRRCELCRRPFAPRGPLLGRFCSQHASEVLCGPPRGLFLRQRGSSNLTEAVRPALSRRSAVSKGLRPGCPPL